MRNLKPHQIEQLNTLAQRCAGWVEIDAAGTSAETVQVCAPAATWWRGEGLHFLCHPIANYQTFRDLVSDIRGRVADGVERCGCAVTAGVRACEADD